MYRVAERGHTDLPDKALHLLLRDNSFMSTNLCEARIKQNTAVGCETMKLYQFTLEITINHVDEDFSKRWRILSFYKTHNQSTHSSCWLPKPSSLSS